MHVQEPCATSELASAAAVFRSKGIFAVSSCVPRVKLIYIMYLWQYIYARSCVFAALLRILWTCAPLKRTSCLHCAHV